VSAVSYSVCFYDLPAAELVEAAVLAEELGLEICWLGEHLFQPSGYASVHPTRDEGTERTAPIVGDRTELLDLWVMAGALGARTTRIRFGTGIYLAALRHPLLSARSMATASSLSGGRLVVGLGAGWLREEFDVLDVGFDDRGARLDEVIAVIRAALHGGPFSHDGHFWRFDSVQISPDPVDVPLIVGGNSPAALRRAGRLGDGWFNSGASAPDELRRARHFIEAERTKAGRGHLPFEYWVRPPHLDLEVSAALALDGFTNQVIWGHQLWPGGTGATLEEKRGIMTINAAELELLPLAGAAQR
jgi:probable F420-dependent oxidoreductase